MNRAVKRFADETSIHGFRDLYYSTKIFWSVCWSATLMGALGMTALQTYQAVNQYMNQQMTVAIEPATNDRIIYPPIHVCKFHWMNWLDWNKAFALNFTREEILVGMSFLQKSYSSNWFDEKQARKDFKKKMTASNFTKLTQFYFAVAKEFPGFKLSEMYKVDNGGLFDEMTFSRKDDFGILFCYVISHGRISDLGNRHTKPVFQVSFRLSKNLYMEGVQYLSKQEHRAYLISVFSTLIPNWVHEAVEEYQDLLVPLQLYPDGNSDFSAQIAFEEDWITVPFTISAHVQKNTQINKCNETTKGILTNTKEKEMCLAKFRGISCQCETFFDASLLNEDYVDSICFYPIKFLYNTSNQVTTEIPELDENKDCHKTETSNGRMCQHVLASCEMWKHSFSIQVDKTSSWAKKNGTDINVIYSTNNILITVEVDSQTWIDLIGSVGGVLGIWTGASLLSFIQIVYLFCFADDKQMAKKIDESAKK